MPGGPNGRRRLSYQQLEEVRLLYSVPEVRSDLLLCSAGWTPALGDTTPGQRSGDVSANAAIGAVAHLEERQLETLEAVGSIPTRTTFGKNRGELGTQL